MQLLKSLFWLFVVLQVNLLVTNYPSGVEAQEPAFELPVELVGFPFIILAVRISNFVKKLAYTVNPKTYVGRTKREAIAYDDMIDMIEAEKRLVSELGENVCIYTKVCLYHAEKTRKTKGNGELVIDWDEIFRNYKSSKEHHKEFYLLSVFLGDFIASPKFCNQLAKRGRACTD
ncbi:uncharacterized protein LOC123686239 isoform X2 [Harmonia axyridis]|uniref:uncharacterized protein LOC123686239 isoform X1 n=1 Tax=Harmonia axyridis TaxID=115357 RepID=UPI001E275995|nr:uncharacterized protein LOC123686239 isoform X1 [Harmonia axyridis]XP_045482213.1 uncharacterized protein LOC123686239 isoform X2 [Harmonia axyridis]